MAFYEFPYVLHRSMNTPVFQPNRNSFGTLAFTPCGKNFILVWQQNASSRSVLGDRASPVGKSADGEKLRWTVMPVFRRLPFQLVVGLGTVERQQRRLGRDTTFGRNQRCDLSRLARNQQPDILLRYFR